MTGDDWLKGKSMNPLLDDLLAGVTTDNGMSRETYEATQPAKQRVER
jgi:hypothetical protein